MRPIADCSSARVRPRASPYSTRARVTGAPPCPASWTRTTCITTPRASAYMWLGEKDSSACFSRRSEEHTSELQSRLHLVCRLLLEKKKYQFRAVVIAYTVHTICPIRVSADLL